MKIAYFTESLSPNIDGVVNTINRLVETLDSEKIEFKFFSPVKPDASWDWHERVTKVSSFSLKPITEYRIGLPYFHGIHDQLNEFKPDLIHIVSQSILGMYGLKYARRANIPVVSSYHTHFVSYFKYHGLQSVEKLGWQYLMWFHNQCDRTFVPSPSAAQELESRGFQRVQLWQRGIELDRFSPSFRDDQLRRAIGAESKPVLLFVGRLVREKDLDDLIVTNEILKNRGHDYKLVLIGDGPMRQECEERLPDAVFTGYQYGADLSKWYASADIFTFPSTTETFGNVILEAFASGLPAVGVDKGGVADLIDHGNTGFIAKSNNPENFAGYVEKLLLDHKLLMKQSHNARLNAKTFDWENINQALVNSYREIITN